MQAIGVRKYSTQMYMCVKLEVSNTNNLGVIGIN